MNKSWAENCIEHDVECEDMVFFNRNLNSWVLSVENSHWDHYNDGFDCTDVEIDYCPFCGNNLNQQNNSGDVRYVQDSIQKMYE